MSDGAILVQCAWDYGQRCESIGLERKNSADLQDAKNHPEFKEAHHKLLDRLVHEYRAARLPLECSAHFTIKGGVFASKEDLVEAVIAKDHKVSEWAFDVINNERFVLMEAGEQCDIVETTVRELTGKDAVTYTGELYEACDKKGFCRVPFEAALVVRMQYEDQPMNMWHYVLSEPLAGSDGFPNILRIGRYSDGSWVEGSSAHPHYRWDGQNRLLVCQKRSTD